MKPFARDKSVFKFKILEWHCVAQRVPAAAQQFIGFGRRFAFC